MYMAKTVELKIKVPNSLSDIPLHEYQRYMQILESVDENTEEASSFVNLKALEIFCGVELKESYKLPMSSFSKILEKLAACLTEDTPLIKRFWLRGSNDVEVEFGMHPDLSNISFGEYVDLDNYTGDWKQLHKMMAVLFRPITAKHKDFYEIEEYESSSKYADYMKYMPASVAVGALVFFYRLGMKLSEHTMDYLLNQLSPEERLQVENRFLEQSGVGISQYIRLLQETSSNSLKSQESHSINV